MKRYRVVVTAIAANNIREAHTWFLGENPAYAAKWLKGLREEILKLQTLPEAHPKAPEGAALEGEIRHFVYGSGNRWRVFFRIQGDAVEVLHVRHTSREPWGS